MGLKRTTIVLFWTWSTVFAANTLQFVNNCPYGLYFWDVGPELMVEDDSNALYVPPNGGTVIHALDV
ncbi:hypothetical protein P280DRAFT_465906, partial [Massarina eburnea CBS 473.64]